MNTILSRVLVDIRSSLNVMPKSTLNKLMVKDVQMRASALIVKAFDGSRKAVIGEIDLPILVSPHIFIVAFHVMDTNPAYSYLLRKPWIHAVEVVTSILHQSCIQLSSKKIW